jgi:Family of unknown function (DUF5335)
MLNREIERNSWVEFFQSFTNDHSGWLTTMDVSDQDAGSKTSTEAQRLPLRDIAADVKDKESTIVITMGVQDDQLLTHEVRTVSSVRLTNDANDSNSTLHIVASDGQTTTLKVTGPSVGK